MLRRLWSEASVTFEGNYERVIGARLHRPGAASNPGVVRWGVVAAYRRAGRLADGWIPDHMVPGPKLDAAKAEVEVAAERAGRGPHNWDCRQSSYGQQWRAGPKPCPGWSRWWDSGVSPALRI